MIPGLLASNGKHIRLFARLMGIVVLVAFIALSFNCFACDSVSVSDPLTGNGHQHGCEKSQHHSDADHCRQHDDNSSDCCSIPVSMVSNSPQSNDKSVAPLPYSQHIVPIIPVSPVALSATESFSDHDPPDELPYPFSSISSISQRAPPMSV